MLIHDPVKSFGIYRRQSCCAALLTQDAPYTSIAVAGHIYRRQVVELSRATLGSWSCAVSKLLEPLYDLLRQYVLMPVKVHTDDTSVPVQEPAAVKPARTVRDDRNAGSPLPPAVWFAYPPDRKGVYPQRHFAGYSGIQQADAYGGYNALYEDGRITEVA